MGHSRCGHEGCDHQGCGHQGGVERKGCGPYQRKEPKHSAVSGREGDMRLPIHVTYVLIHKHNLQLGPFPTTKQGCLLITCWEWICFLFGQTKITTTFFQGQP